LDREGSKEMIVEGQTRTLRIGKVGFVERARAKTRSKKHEASRLWRRDCNRGIGEGWIGWRGQITHTCM
jgi:hypothetical protein